MTPKHPSTDSFAEWFRSRAVTLRSVPADQAAAEIGEELALLDARLGVEILDDEGESPRELIITGFSDPAAFPMVKELAGSIGRLPGWQVIALKPPRGFDFELTVAGDVLEAQLLEFAPTPDVKGGIRLLVPDRLIPDASKEQLEELAWLVVETGVGEELAGHISHVELQARSNATVRWPIRKLPDFLRATAPM